MKRLLVAVAVTVLVVGGNLLGQTAPLWDGRESVTDYAKRAGIKDVQIEVKLDAKVTMKLALIPAGEFAMGSPDSEMYRIKGEGPQHKVTISKPFYMGVYEVTQEQYEAVIGKNPSNFKGATNPVEQVSWDEAAEFCKKLSTKTGKTVLLPTEAQWELACRAGTSTPFNTGQTIGADQANYAALFTYGNGVKGENRKRTIPVGSFKPNGFGLYDMHGNVAEWCRDWYRTYSDKKEADPTGPTSGARRVLRGGGWNALPWDCRSAYRLIALDDRNRHFGFRVVVNPD